MHQFEDCTKPSLCFSLFPWWPSLDFSQEPRAYGQVRGLMPFSCAYFAADASTRGRTSA